MSGALSSLFSSGVAPPVPTGSDTSTTNPLWYQQYLWNLANTATNVAGQAYTPFPGQQVATPSGDTQQSWQMAAGNTGNYMPALNAATGMTSAAAAPIGADQINQYMSPYTNDVVHGLQTAANKNLFENQLPRIQSQFVSAGQAASPQQAQQYNDALYQSNQALDYATAQALQSGYGGALNTAVQEQNNMRTAGAQMGTLGSLTQQLGASDTGMVASAGQSQDAINQANINASLNNFYTQQNWPYQNLAFASNVVRGQNIPTNTQQVGTTYAPASAYTASPLSTFVGTALGASALSNGSNSGSRSLGLRDGGRVRHGALRRYAKAA